MAVFKRGDRVRCVSSAGGLSVGEIYKIADTIAGEWFYLLGQSGAYNQAAFERIEEPPFKAGDRVICTTDNVALGAVDLVCGLECGKIYEVREVEKAGERTWLYLQGTHKDVSYHARHFNHAVERVEEASSKAGDRAVPEYETLRDGLRSSYKGQLSETFQENTPADQAISPDHYALLGGESETIDLILDRCAAVDGPAGVLYGNTIKYLMRWPHKGAPVEDLKKCRRYLDWLIEEIDDTE